MNAFTILNPYAGIWLAVLLFATLWSPAQVLISQRTTSLSCAALPYHQFDFWVGDWDAFDSGTPRAVARVRVERILDRCVLLENYEDTSGAKGKSFSIYDASTGRWHQSWVTNKGRLLLIDGNFEGNAMVLSGKDRTADGKDRLVRGTWKPLKDGVREIGVTSMDGGRTWQPWFEPGIPATPSLIVPGKVVLAKPSQVDIAKTTSYKQSYGGMAIVSFRRMM